MVAHAFNLYTWEAFTLYTWKAEAGVQGQPGLEFQDRQKPCLKNPINK